MWGIVFGLMCSYTNLYNILILGEIIWVLLYLYGSFLSSLYDSLFIFVISVYLLSLATGETVIGLALLILRMSVFGSINNYDILSTQNYLFYRNTKINLISSKKK